MLSPRLILLVMLISVFCSYSQNNDTISSVPESGISDLEQQFRSKNDISSLNGIRSRIMSDCDLMTEPSPGSAKTGITIPKDSIAYAFKYFNTERYWAVKYKNNWGFVKDDVVFPVFESDIEKKVSKYDEPPQLKTQIKPVYPPEAEKKGIKGKVYVKVFIDENGVATDAIILEGISELNQAAIDAVKKAKYKPAHFEGKEVGVWVNLSINFN